MLQRSVEELLREEQPRVLSAFASTAAPVISRDEHMVTGGFELACAKCASSHFRLFEIASRYQAADGSARDSVVGLSTTCALCGRSAEIFDAVRDGYDGENGHLGFLDGPRNRSPLKTAAVALEPVQLRVWFTFNSDTAELAETASGLGIGPLDLFDGVSVEGRAEAGAQWDWIWEYECA